MINFLAIFFLDPKSYICRELKPHGKFQNPTITPSGRKVTQGEREEEEKIVDPMMEERLGKKCNLSWFVIV